MEYSSTYYHDSKPVMPVDLKVRKILDKYLVGIFIARKGGDILYSKQFGNKKKVQHNLMSNFIAALSLFGEENVGKIKRICVEGLDIEMNIVAKHDLILTMMFKPHMVKNHLPEYYDKGLDQFYFQYEDHIKNNRTNQAIYDNFEPKMLDLLYEYILHLEAL